jgi:hypothetical protein
VADRFIALTQMGAGSRDTSILVNLGSVAWIEPDADGSSRIIFAVSAPDTRENGAPLSITVRESIRDIALLVGTAERSDSGAIAQAWADQTARRDSQYQDE